MELRNPNLARLPIDNLFHLGLDSSMPLSSMFGDLKVLKKEFLEPHFAISTKIDKAILN